MVASPPDVSPVRPGGPTEVILTVVMIAVYCYISLARARCYVRLGIVRGTGAIRKRSAFA